MEVLLQTSPQGLLGALDQKTDGRNPNAFDLTLHPNYVANEHYYLPRRNVSTDSGVATGAVGATLSTQTVPNNEVWRVKGASILLARAVGDIALTLEFVLNVRRPNSNIAVAFFTPRFEATVATDLTQSRAIWLGKDLWAGPGDSFTLVQRSTMAAGTVGASLDIDKFPNS